jgi:hypothetical protein
MKTKKQKKETDKNKIMLRKLAKSAKAYVELYILVMTKLVIGGKTVVVKFPLDIPGILLKSRDICDHMTGNLLFPDAQDMLPAFKEHIEDAFALQAKMIGRGKSITEKRNKAVYLVITETFDFRIKVQKVVNQDRKYAQDIAISAGMDIKKFTPRAKQKWSAYYTGMKGEIELQGVYLTQRCAYQWQATFTPEIEASWRDMDIDVTIRSTTIIKGLIPGTMVYFRYRIIVSAGPKAWSDALSMIII